VEQVVHREVQEHQDQVEQVVLQEVQEHQGHQVLVVRAVLMVFQVVLFITLTNQ
jgi:hypothetical protein